MKNKAPKRIKFRDATYQRVASDQKLKDLKSYVADLDTIVDRLLEDLSDIKREIEDLENQLDVRYDSKLEDRLVFLEGQQYDKGSLVKDLKNLLRKTRVVP